MNMHPSNSSDDSWILIPPVSVHRRDGNVATPALSSQQDEAILDELEDMEPIRSDDLLMFVVDADFNTNHRIMHQSSHYSRVGQQSSHNSRVGQHTKPLLRADGETEHASEKEDHVFILDVQDGERQLSTRTIPSDELPSLVAASDVDDAALVAPPQTTIVVTDKRGVPVELLPLSRDRMKRLLALLATDPDN